MMKEEKDVSSIFLLQVGENIKKKRKENKLSLEKLGLEVGLTRMQIHRIEKGYNITLKTLIKISLALNLKAEELVRFEHKVKKDDLEKLVNKNKSFKKKLK